MKKQLNTTGIINELSGASPFFPAKQQEKRKPKKEENQLPLATQKSDEPTSGMVVSRHHDTLTPRVHDTTIPIDEDDIIEAVRKAVKPVGKDGATLRCTSQERQALDDIEYSYKRQGIRTSGNEITRIGINYVVKDYRKNGENSILAKVLKRLNS